MCQHVIVLAEVAAVAVIVVCCVGIIAIVRMMADNQGKP
jgi:hypothetical protein